MAEGQKNLKMSGSAHVSGGNYDEVRVSGSAHIDGDVTCNSMRISGSAHLNGAIKAGECKISGSAHISGALEAEHIRISGSCNTEKDLTATEEIAISGGAKVGGGMKAKVIKLSGSVKVGVGIECEEMEASGAFVVNGLINAGKLLAKLAGKSSADEIGGEEIIVKRENSVHSFKMFGVNLAALAGLSSTLTVNAVEGSRVYLENTFAKVVRGENVEIGTGCDIERVEYSGTLMVDDGAKVGDRIKI
jgi:cytoskeletal protein CcmA (bactofilin family)